VPTKSRLAEDSRRAGKEQKENGEYGQKNRPYCSGIYKKSIDYFVCSVCGYIAENSPPEKCPVCSAVHGKFKKEV